MKTLKVFLLSIPVVFCYLQSAAQGAIDSTHTVVDSFQRVEKVKKPFHSAGFFQADGSFYSILGKPAAFTEFNLNWLINHKIYVGAKCQLLSTSLDISKYLYDDTTGKVTPTHIAALMNFGVIFFHEKKFSLNPELSLGWGNLNFDKNHKSQKLNYGVGVFSLNGVWNAHKNVRIGLGVGGKAVMGQNFEGLKSYKLSGAFGHVFIRVGTF